MCGRFLFPILKNILLLQEYHEADQPPEKPEEPAETEKQDETVEENEPVEETQEEPQPEEEVVEAPLPLISTEDTGDLLVGFTFKFLLI